MFNVGVSPKMTPNMKWFQNYLQGLCLLSCPLIVPPIITTYHLPGTSSRRSQRPGAASTRCISPPSPPCLSSSCKSDGMLLQWDYYWDLILFSGIIFTLFFLQQILPAKSFWSHGRFLMAGSFENVTWNLKIFTLLVFIFISLYAFI